MEEKINSLTQNKFEVYILGEMNIDFFIYNSHPKTQEYLDVLYTKSFLPVITKQTRITDHTATLIDHMYIC